ncbi:hypothetical protein ACSBR1_016199 [Camellia fascicularis]
MAAPDQPITEASMNISLAKCLELPQFSQFRTRRAGSDPISNHTPTVQSIADERYKKALRELKSIREDLKFIKNASEQLKEYKAHFADEIETASKKFKSLEDEVNRTARISPGDTNKMVGIYKDISEFQKEVKKLKLQIADERREKADRQLKSVRQNLEYIQKASEQLKEFEAHVGDQIETTLKELDRLEVHFNPTNGISHLDTDKMVGICKDISEFQKKVTKLKLKIPSKHQNRSAANSDAHRNQSSNGSTHTAGQDSASRESNMPNLCKNETFGRSSEFKDFKALYDGLDITHKVCLLSFSVFPENEIISRRFMTYWWIGEGFVRPSPGNQKTAEASANDVFKQLVKKGFIEPVHEKHSLEVNRCRMHPFIRTAVIMLADKAQFFHFDPSGNLTAGFPFSHQVCILAGQQLDSLDLDKVHSVFNVRESDFEKLEMLSRFKNANKGLDLDKVHTVFNVDETILDFDKPELFSRMRNANVLCLGRWQTSPKHHIEVEDTKFLENLKHMKHLRFLSLQGISRISELPGSISKLASLMILDLRACHNLEILPDGIDSLKCLTHLDMSECYLLGNMPKGLSSLSELEVLKGFAVGNSTGKKSCSLDDLVNLRKLRKLSIYTSVEDFPRKTELESLSKFEKLRTLTIVWGGGSEGKSHKNNAKQEKVGGKSTAANLPKPENKRHGKTQGEAATEDAKQENREVISTDADVQYPENGGNNNIKTHNTASASDSPAAPTAFARSITRKLSSLKGDRAVHFQEIKAEENKRVGKTGDSSGGEVATGADAKQENRAVRFIDTDVQNPENGGNNNIKTPNSASAADSPAPTAVTRSSSRKSPAVFPEFPTQLEKLDLQCFPQSYAPNWLKASKMTKLKKLYIRGGTLCDLGQFEEVKDEWKVERLRLKFLNDLEMDWREFKEIFPRLIYLEKVRCAKLTLFPCDELGVWISKTENSE